MLWLGTESGLYRYDGYTLKRFSHNPDDPYSVPSDVIYDIAEDAEGFLWIAANESGPVRYDPATGRFERFPLADGTSLTVQRVDPRPAKPCCTLPGRLTAAGFFMCTTFQITISSARSSLIHLGITASNAL